MPVEYKMSFFNKGFQAFRAAPSIFNKVAGGARSVFGKTPSAFRALSGGLGQASRALGSAAATGDRLLSDPAVANLAKQLGAGGIVGSARGLTGGAGSASALLGRASAATNPATYSGMSPVAAASSAIERGKSLARDTKKRFL